MTMILNIVLVALSACSAGLAATFAPISERRRALLLGVAGVGSIIILARLPFDSSGDAPSLIYAVAAVTATGIALAARKPVKRLALG